MRLAGEAGEVLLAEGGKQVLELAGLSIPDTLMLPVSIEESEDLGLWIQVRREDRLHVFLLRWEYILGIDLPRQLGKVTGLKG